MVHRSIANSVHLDAKRERIGKLTALAARAEACLRAVGGVDKIVHHNRVVMLHRERGGVGLRSGSSARRCDRAHEKLALGDAGLVSANELGDRLDNATYLGVEIGRVVNHVCAKTVICRESRHESC